MDVDAIWRVIDEERGRLAGILDDLSDDEWRTPSLCAGWTVRDVAAHLTLAHTGLGPATVGLIRAGGSFNRMVRDTALRQARLPVAEFPRRIRAMVGSRRTAPFLTAREPLIDILCHTQDIVRPLGRSHTMPPDAAAEAASHIWTRSFPFRAQKRLRGFALQATDAPWRVGAGVPLEGPMSALLLLVSGRAAALSELSGPGASQLADTFPPDVPTRPSPRSPDHSAPQTSPSRSPGHSTPRNSPPHAAAPSTPRNSSPRAAAPSTPRTSSPDAGPPSAPRTSPPHAAAPFASRSFSPRPPDPER